MHPTVKPVALVEDAIKDCSRRGETVLDPFGGSGTTLIAAERTGRVGRLIELDPAYCDGIVRRYETLTGKQGQLISTQQTFEAVAEERAGTGHCGAAERSGPEREAAIEDLFIKEYLRPVKVREGDRVQTMPAIQVIMRAEISKGVKGSGPSQRSVLRTARQIGREWQARQEGLLQAAIEFKVAAERERTRAEQEGRTHDPTLLDPDTVKVDLATGDVRLRLPDHSDSPEA